MKDQTDRLEQLCEKFLKSEIEDMTKRELFEIVLLFADRKTEPSLRETLLTRYDSHLDMLSDFPEYLCQIGRRGTILAGLAKLIRELSPAFGAVGYEGEASDKTRYSDRAANYCIANSSDNIEKLCKILASRHYDTTREVFHAAFLDGCNRVVYEENVAYGNAGDVYIDFKSLIRKALKHEAKGILLAHNHPDGNLTPSYADIRLTERLKQACEMLEMKFVDHIIVYCGRFRSIVRRDGACNTGDIMDMFSSPIDKEKLEGVTEQIGHSGIYRQISASDFEEDMKNHFEEYESSELPREYAIEITPDDYENFFPQSCFEY